MVSLGFSIGGKTEKGRKNTLLTEDETTNQQQTGTKTQTGTSTSTQTGTSTSAGQTASQQTESATQTGAKSSTAAGETRLFSDDVLANLENLIGGLSNKVGESGVTVDNAIASLRQFDPNAFVSSSVAAAEGKERTNLDEIFGGLADTIGSGIENNSMAALLANRASGDAAARVEGVRAQAMGTAQEANRGNQAAVMQGSQLSNNLLLGMLEQLKGGIQATSQVGGETSTGATAGTTAATGTTSEAGSQTQAGTQTQNLIEALEQLLTGTTHKVGTENTTTKGLTLGGGLSASG